MLGRCAAVEMQLKYRPNVVLMDLAMPGMDGYEAMRGSTITWSNRLLLTNCSTCCGCLARAGCRSASTSRPFSLTAGELRGWRSQLPRHQPGLERGGHGGEARA